MKNFNFGQNLEMVREHHGISIPAISLAMDMSNNEYSQLEKESDPPKIEIVDKLCEFLEINDSLLMKPDLTPKQINDAVYNLKFKSYLLSPKGLTLYGLAGFSAIYSAHNMAGHISDFLGATAETSRIVALTCGVASFVFLVIFLISVYRRKV